MAQREELFHELINLALDWRVVRQEAGIGGFLDDRLHRLFDPLIFEYGRCPFIHGVPASNWSRPQRRVPQTPQPATSRPTWDAQPGRVPSCPTSSMPLCLP